MVATVEGWPGMQGGIIVLKTQVSCLTCGHTFMVSGTVGPGEKKRCGICETEREVVPLRVYRQLMDPREVAKA